MNAPSRTKGISSSKRMTMWSITFL